MLDKVNWIGESNQSLQFLDFDALTGPLSYRCKLGLLVKERNRHIMNEMERRNIPILAEELMKVFEVSKKAT